MEDVLYRLKDDEARRRSSENIPAGYYTNGEEARRESNVG
jgi:hypothetical protein